MKARISLFINQTPGSAHFRIFHRTKLVRRYDDLLEFPEGAGDIEILNEVFRLFNADHPAGYTGPSLSVADVVTIDEDRSYEVLAWGFGRLPHLVTGEKFTVLLPDPRPSEIKAWRTAEKEAGRDYSIDAFFRAHNMCRACRGHACDACGGTGEYPSTEEERVLQGIRNLAASIREGARAS